MTLIDSGLPSSKHRRFGYMNVIPYHICSQRNLICSHLIQLVLMSVLLREIAYRQLSISQSPLGKEEKKKKKGKKWSRGFGGKEDNSFFLNQHRNEKSKGEFSTVGS